MTTHEQTRILSIFHYVAGGMHILFGCFGLIDVVLGWAFIAHPEAWHPTQGDAPPVAFGYLFIFIGGAIFLIGLTLGTLTIFSGRFISRRIHRTYSIVVASINCALFPFGTALGIFDLILLTKDEVKAEYATKLGDRAQGI